MGRRSIESLGGNNGKRSTIKDKTQIRSINQLDLYPNIDPGFIEEKTQEFLISFYRSRKRFFLQLITWMLRIKYFVNSKLVNKLSALVANKLGSNWRKT